MNKQQTLKQIEELYESASLLALKLIESEARKLLRNHNSLNEFVMAMGSTFFIDKHGEVVDNWRFKYIEQFTDLINDLDDRFHITGTPMRFTANGPIVTNW
jgi:hypothetical protein